MKILYLITEDWFFCSHFLERAVAARAQGHDVVVVTREAKHADAIRDRDIRVVPMAFDRSGLNPLTDLGTIRALMRVYRTESPDLAHHVALKPILYGTIAARRTSVPAVVNAPVGMGHLFTSEQHTVRIVRAGVLMALRRLLNPPGSRVVFENGEDFDYCLQQGLARKSACTIIPGAGVDVEAYPHVPEPDGVPVVAFVGRMLWSKGVGDFVEAARLLLTRGVKARFLLVGAPDAGNPAAIDIEQLRRWHQEKVIDWLGHREDVAEILRASHVFCLPSHREGLPKAILEASASGRPVVTSDVVGCREVIRHGENGLLVPPSDPASLAAALAELIADQALRVRLGSAGRERVVREFSSERVIGETLALYRELEGNSRVSPMTAQ